MTNFSFVDNVILRSNLDLALDHINELVTVSESKTYSNKPIQISSFRKTIIIHIAAIIEAILLWKFKKVCTSQKVELDNDWKYLDIKILYKIIDSEEIIAGKRVKKKRPIDKLNFLQITKQCLKYKVIKSKLAKDIDQVRTYRNKQHLGGLSAIEQRYSKKNLEFCFSVAERAIREASV